MLRRISDIFKKTAGSKAFWAGVLLCLTFTMINPSLSVADDDGWDYECPSMDVPVSYTHLTLPTIGG